MGCPTVVTMLRRSTALMEHENAIITNENCQAVYPTRIASIDIDPPSTPLYRSSLAKILRVMFRE